jgi:hypothetical protein
MVHYLAGQLSSRLNISGAITVVKPASGKLVSVAVITAGTILIYDGTLATGNTVANQIAALTGAAVGVYKMDFPFLAGLVIDPGAGVVAVSYE